MRIAYIINSLEGGGAALPVPALLGVMRSHGAAPHVFALTRRDGRALAPIRDAGFPVTLREGGERDHLAAFRWLRAEMRAFRPDLIWTSLSRATLLGQLCGRALNIPVVSWQHAAFLKPWNRRLLRLVRGQTALWVADSASVARFARDKLLIEENRLMVWPIFRADPSVPQASPWRQGETLRLGALGRLHPVKGYDVLIEALARLRAEGFTPATPFTITIGGDGAEGAALREKARAAGVNSIEWAGYLDDPKSFLAGLHGYLQPSRSEGFCIAGHEAMLAGLPVIASAVGELRYSIDPGKTGWLTAPGDARALAGALAEMLGAPERLAAMGAAARADVAARYSAEKFEAAGGAILARIPRQAASHQGRGP